VYREFLASYFQDRGLGFSAILRWNEESLCCSFTNVI